MRTSSGTSGTQVGGLDVRRRPGHLHAVDTLAIFRASPSTRVLTCVRVRDGASILHVSHDEDGDWQFLCGGEHPEGGADGPVTSCLGCVLEGDPSLIQLGELCTNWDASRSSRGEPWMLRDRAEDFIRHWVRKLGWAVQLVTEGDGERAPPLAYTVGLARTFDHPAALMHSMLNECAVRVRHSEGRSEWRGARGDVRGRTRGRLDRWHARQDAGVRAPPAGAGRTLSGPDRGEHAHASREGLGGIGGGLSTGTSSEKASKATAGRGACRTGRLAGQRHRVEGPRAAAPGGAQ